MNYFDPYPCLPDQTTISAWDSQVAEIARTPRLTEVFGKCGSEIFPRFAACYGELRALPRSARRALQRRLARSAELAAILPEWLQSQGGRALQHKLARSLAGAALLLALGQGIVGAATINVTTNNPKVKRDGECSLIEAIINANRDAAKHKDCPAGSGADIIVLPSSADITLNSVKNRTYGPTGLPVITSPITIEGNGAKIVRSDKKRVLRFRLIAVSNTGDLTLQNVTLSGGSSRSTDTHTNHGYGGGALNYGNLTIEGSTISGNKAQNSGGGVFNRGTLTIENSIVSGNTTYSGGGGVDSRGIFTLESSTLSGNRAASGGGVANSDTLTIKNSTISGNSALFVGGGVANGGDTLHLENSAVSDNEAGFGGGISNGGTLSIETSAVSGNKVDHSGGGIFNYGTVNVAGSMIVDNSAGSGGGVFNTSNYYSPSTLSITNSTVSGNEASGNGGGIYNSGPFCYYYCYFGGSLNLLDSTITQNVAGDSGGGLFNEGNLNMTNSVISNNQAPNGPDIFP